MMDPVLCLSGRLGPLGPRVEALVKENVRVWDEAPIDPPEPRNIYPLRVKKDVEGELSALIDRVRIEHRKHGAGGAGWETAGLEEIAAGLRPFIKRLVDRVDIPLASVYDARFLDSTRRFIRAARDFDPDLRVDAVYQALRNVWIMNTLQLYLGREVEATDAIVGYSLIYPYLDNYLDDAAVSEPDKLNLVVKLRRWLEGEDDPPEGPLEDRLQALIRMIEDEFGREGFPGVYQSLLAIHNAQIKSLLQQRKSQPPGAVRVLEISLEKGGTSVLADGYLAAGKLEPSEEAFCFGLGTVLQLADDLQDIAEDLRRGHITLFSQAAGTRPLDPLVHKLWRFMSLTADRTLDERRPRERALKNVLVPGCGLLYAEAAGKHARYFSKNCLRGLEETFPVRFSYLKKVRRALPEKFLSGAEKIGSLDSFTIALMSLSSRAFALD